MKVGLRAGTENDILGDAEEIRALGRKDSEWGVVGWTGDQTQSDVIHAGDGSDGPTGPNLVKVTLFKGRDITKRPVQGQAQGRQILCQLGWPLLVVPPLGMKVAVLFPGGDQNTPGNGVIVCGVSPVGASEVDATHALLDVGDTVDLRIRGTAGSAVVLTSQAGALPLVKIGLEATADVPALEGPTGIAGVASQTVQLSP